ncbi:protein Gawky [Onthophagus taurus]|uniref:protein Gawky n=1 Tax=Onthophagus taurus TaxID=166361 RepID=UPI000C1FF238|nr:protein Gawky [Onthophagus taurus]XP_022916639.1 protein Gawky [Onthophagus taurus]XP_022916640.1 protein Gawky [Onthophagus taurus]
MRVPTPSEPKNYTFPTFQVPQLSAMRGRAPLVQQKHQQQQEYEEGAPPPIEKLTLMKMAAPPSTPHWQRQAASGAQRGGRADPPPPAPSHVIHSVIAGSGRSGENGLNPPLRGKTDLRCDPTNNVRTMQSVTENCLLNSVTVPNKCNKNNIIINNSKDNNDDIIVIVNEWGYDDERKKQQQQRNNDKSNLAIKCIGALNHHFSSQDIPYEKSDDLLEKYYDNDDDDFEPTITATSTDLPTINNAYFGNSFYRQRDITTTTNTFSTSKLIYEDNYDYSRAYAPPLRLRGGGESSISAGTTGWGTPPSQQASNNNGNTSGWGTANSTNQNNAGTQQWNTNSNRPPTSGPGNSQDSNKQNSNLPQNGQQPPTTQSNNGWGQPSKPQPGGSVPNAVATVNNPSANANSNNAQGQQSNSTKQQLEQLTNMREAIFSHDGWGGQHVNQDTNWDIPGSPEPQLKMDGSGTQAWKPTVNNGTELWEANLRNGGQPPPQPQQKAPWGHTPSTNIGGTWGEDDDVTDSSNVWTGVPPAQQPWGGANNANTGNTSNTTAMWGGPKKENDWGTGGATNAAAWGDPRTADPRAAAMDPRDMRPDHRDIRTGTSDPMRMLDPRDQMRLVGGDMRGDPRGITGRLNGAGADAFWTQTAQQTTTHHMHQPKMPMGPGNNTGWEEPSPPSQRRNIPPNYDDGTSLWGNPQQGGAMGRNNAAGPPGMPQSRIKPDGAVWGHGRNGSWDDSGPGWDETGPWPKQKLPGAPIWDNDGDWVGHKPGPKQPPISKELLWNSRQFRTLVDMGYKKEDVENALRMRDMNMDDALDMLGTLRNQNLDGWRGRHDDHYDHPQFAGQRFPTGPAAQMNFPPGANPPSLLNNLNSAAAGANSSLINNMSPAIVQKMLSQSGGNQSYGASNLPGARSALQPPSQPSTAQLRMLVQQIQMAVQAGYLNHQILNQPLAPQTLVLLNQLLQQIKTLQQLGNQQNMAQQQCIGGKANNTYLQCSVLITKTKQQIQNLQNQIAAQQAIYVKQQHNMGSGGAPTDLFKSTAMHDSINSLQSNFADIGLKDTQMSQQQSRLNQWKLPTLDKEEGGEFSRAPGSVSKSLAPSHSSPNLNNPLGLTQPDGPWSSGRSGDTGWPDSGAGDAGAPDLKDSSQWVNDLVPEFEPGKPWKGTQMKSIEDDPSITPGSVVRSPLSVATIKNDNELFNINANKSPPLGDNLTPLSLSSSTWSFNPPASTATMISSPQNKLPTSKVVLGDLNTPTAVTTELWGAPKPRGPPPGLSAKGINGWSSNLGGNASGPWGGTQRNWCQGGGSPWVLLKNLTAQIDGSTLRTLCMQHGPLQSFHLHQGFALIKYTTREEAAKAQTALNNCVLGNTTILAENPSEWEASLHLQQVSSQQGGSTGSWRNSGKQQVVGTADTWSTGWPNASSTSLWGSSALDSADQSRATPSSLNSYLPGDLLGGESM